MTPIHNFHIPVMGMAFSIDTPLKVAQYGISSVISIMEEDLLELMREHYCKKHDIPFIPVPKKEEDSRAKRITAYLDMVHDLIQKQMENLLSQPFQFGQDIVKYCEMLPEDSYAKSLFSKMLHTFDNHERLQLEQNIKSEIRAGSIDVNIMSKVDNLGAAQTGEPLPVEQSDALTALRGYAHSKLHSSIVFSAGYNPRLYGYLSAFDDFFPNQDGYLKKRVILK